jgi:hypothetical protein
VVGDLVDLLVVLIGVCREGYIDLGCRCIDLVVREDLVVDRNGGPFEDLVVVEGLLYLVSENLILQDSRLIIPLHCRLG